MDNNYWARLVRRALLTAALLVGGTAFAYADNPSMMKDFNFEKPTFIHDLPFAKYKLVLQVSSANQQLWNLTLNNVQNVLDNFGQSNVRIVVVAYGPGLLMLLKNSAVSERLAAQDAEGVEFDACHVTMEAMAKKLGHMPVLAPSAVIVPGGVVRLMQLQKNGFAYIKP